MQTPLSPTLSAVSGATTSASALNFQLGDDRPAVLITRADLRASVSAYQELLSSSKAYRNAVQALSSSATLFASALEECARVKGAYESGANLLAASGLQYMIANSGQVLGDALYKSFEIPLMEFYDEYQATVSNRHVEYEALLAEKTAAIRKTEDDNLKAGRKKIRDLSQFRKALERLQEQVREVEVCKKSYYQETLDHERETWGMISGKVALLLRSTLDLADRLSSKATSDPTIEAMVSEHPDPFDSYRLEPDERDVFSVLPPLGDGGFGFSGIRKKRLDPEMVREVIGQEEDEDSEGGVFAGLYDKQGSGTRHSSHRSLSNKPSSTNSVSGTTSPILPVVVHMPGNVNVAKKPLSVAEALGIPSTIVGSPHRSIPSNVVDDSRSQERHPSSDNESLERETNNANNHNNHNRRAHEDVDDTEEDSEVPINNETTSGTTKPARKTRQNLSRVSESLETDPMAGDWQPELERVLSPVNVGFGEYDSDYEYGNYSADRRKQTNHENGRSERDVDVDRFSLLRDSTVTTANTHSGIWDEESVYVA